jgi:hypothetical protein
MPHSQYFGKALKQFAITPSETLRERNSLSLAEREAKATQLRESDRDLDPKTLLNCPMPHSPFPFG